MVMDDVEELCRGRLPSRTHVSYAWSRTMPQTAVHIPWVAPEIEKVSNTLAAEFYFFITSIYQRPVMHPNHSFLANRIPH